MRIVVTGGAGFIGANLCRELAERGAVREIVVLDDLSTGHRSNLDLDRVSLEQASILDETALSRALAGASTVVHLAARPSVARSLADPAASHEVNATGTVAVLEAARKAGVPHVIVASSSSVYGANPELPKHEDLATRPQSPYAASKLAAESYALAYQASFGLGVLAFRFFNVFGPLQSANHDYAAVIPAFVSAALSHRPLPLHGDGRQTRDFTFVDSVTDILASAATAGVVHPTPLNLAFGGRTDLLTLISMIADIVGYELEIEHLPPRPGDVRDSQADQRELRRLFPSVAPVDLTTGLRRTVEWFQNSPAQNVER